MRNRPSPFVILGLLLSLTGPVAAEQSPYALPSDDPEQPANLHQSLYPPVRRQQARDRREMPAQKALKSVDRKQMPAPGTPNDAASEVDEEQVPAPVNRTTPREKKGYARKDMPPVLAAPAAPNATGPVTDQYRANGTLSNSKAPARRRLMLQLAGAPTAAQLQALRALGFHIEFVRENFVQGWAGDEALVKATELPFVRFIAPVVPVQARAATSSQPGVDPRALLDLRALQAQGAQGQQVRIAVVDVGFAPGHPALKGHVAGTRSLRLDHDISGAGEWRHGNAVAEVAAAVAPGARLFLVNFDPDSVFGYLQAIDEAVNRFHAQVVTLSVNFPTPYDFYNGHGLLARALDGYARKGVLFVAAAGNNGLRHFSARFSDPAGQGQHRFADGDAWRVTIPAGEPADLYLAWDDEWNDHVYRLGLYVFDEQRRLVAYSNARQGQPVQFCTLEPAETSHNYAVVVSGNLTYRRDPRDAHSDLITGQGPRFHLFVYADDAAQVVPAVPESSLDPNFPVAGGAITVGAVQARMPARLEPFSSRGRTSDGREKPDIVAPSGLRTAALPDFAGTSAAAPFVAGTAALVLARHPNWSPAQLKAVLRHTARDLGPTGWDIGFGAGLVDPAAALRSNSP